LSFKERGPHAVSLPLERMLTTIKLHDNLRFEAAEIRDEGADRMLSPELELRQPPVPQPPPEPSFCVCP
jgi:hypothetical protein